MKETIQAPFVFQVTRGAFVEAGVESSSSPFRGGDEPVCTQSLVHTRTMSQELEAGMLEAVTQGFSSSHWEFQELTDGDWKEDGCDRFVELDVTLGSKDKASDKLAQFMTTVAALVAPPQQRLAGISRMFMYELDSGVNAMHLDMCDKDASPIPSWTVVAHIGDSRGCAMQLEFEDAHGECYKVELRPPMCYAMPGWHTKHRTVVAPAERVVLGQRKEWYSVVCFFKTPDADETKLLVTALMTGEPVFLPPDTKSTNAVSPDKRTKRKRTQNARTQEKRSRKTRDERPTTEQGVAFGPDEPQLMGTMPGPVFATTQEDVLTHCESVCPRRKVVGDGDCLFYCVLAGIGLLQHTSMTAKPTSRDKRLAMALRKKIAVEYGRLNRDFVDTSCEHTFGDTSSVLLLAKDLKVKVCVLDETRLETGTVIVCENGKQHNVLAETYLQQRTDNSGPEAVKPCMMIISEAGFEDVGGHFALLQEAQNWEMPEWLRTLVVPANTPAAITGTCTVTTSQQAPPDKRRTGAGNAGRGTPQEPAPPKNSNTEPTVPPPANPQRRPTQRMCIPDKDWAAWKKSNMARERNAQATAKKKATNRSAMMTLSVTRTLT
jgi:hypothetical protein